MKLTILVIGFLCLPVCVSAQTSGNSESEQKKETSQSKAGEKKLVPLNRRIYYFQHRILSQWTHKSNGAFLKDLMSGNSSRLVTSAKKMISADYASGITVKPVGTLAGVLITFPKPTQPAECYYAAVVKQGEKYRYFTYERTLDITGAGFVGVVGSWTAQGSHLNFGPRMYRDANSFLKDVVKLTTVK